MIAIPDFVSGAMEHWGLITYRQKQIDIHMQIDEQINYLKYILYIKQISDYIFCSLSISKYSQIRLKINSKIKILEFYAISVGLKQTNILFITNKKIKNCILISGKPTYYLMLKNQVLTINKELHLQFPMSWHTSGLATQSPQSGGMIYGKFSFVLFGNLVTLERFVLIYGKFLFIQFGKWGLFIVRFNLSSLASWSNCTIRFVYGKI